MTISHLGQLAVDRRAQVTGASTLPFDLLAQRMQFIRSIVTSRLVRPVFLAVFVMHLVACATPTTKLIDIAESEAFEQSQKRANGFKLLVLQNTKAAQSGDQLHIYLEGDGTPWKYRVLRTRDPTPRQPLMLRLMALDSTAAAYVGRPCYNGAFADEGCSDDLWTSARYSEKVVASMTGVIQQLVKARGATSVRLFGHSGGGTLAMLIAERIPQVEHVVTLAANLDTEAWVAHHRYSPLYGSLNPAKQTPLRNSVRQWHFLGSQDAVVPANLVKPFVSAQSSAFGFEVGNFNHGCCWRRMWPRVLRALNAGNTNGLPGIRFKFPR